MQKFAVSLTFIAVSATLSAQLPQKYVVVELGTLGAANTGNQTSAFAINNAGQVAGNSHLANAQVRGFRTAPNSPINPATDGIGTLGGNFSSATSINSSGQVAGIAKNSDTPHIITPFASTPTVPSMTLGF